MSIHVALHHRSDYRYDRPVTVSPQVIRLRPAPHCRTEILSYALTIDPKPHFINWQQDPQSNWLARVVFPEPVTHFTVDVDLVADLKIINPFDFFVEDSAEFYPFSYEPALAKELKPFLQPKPAGLKLRAWLDQIPQQKSKIIDFLVSINQQLQQDISYTIRLEPGIQTPEQTLTKRSGSCRDSAWLLVQALRHLGFAARFVSGYLLQLKPDVKALDGPTGTDEDFTDLHAWTEVYIPGAGWVGMDPTSGLFAGEGHIPVAATPEPSSAAPITGSTDECEVEFNHHMAIQRVAETPRVTKPYTQAQWQAIDALGQAVDHALERQDVRLTMGGEPTFVATDDPDAAEWNTAAVGPTKQAYAEQLVERLQQRLAPDGCVVYAQGKWYPGEPLPRWAYNLYWRKDNKPLWKNSAPALQPSDAPPPSIQQAQRFIQALADRLEVDPANAVAGYEDPWHYLAQERKLPINLSTQDNRLDNEQDRQRLAEVFEQGLSQVRGYTLPIQRWQSQARWMSEKWQFRQGRMFLIPGDSPMGLRLPLDTLPWVAATDQPFIVFQDPLEPRGALPDHHPRRQPFLHGRRSLGSGDETAKPQEQQAYDYSEGQGIQTALCVEPREGNLSIFMPPVHAVEDYLELLAAIEDTAAELEVPIRLEGYTPPADPRLDVIKVTPDPGVIEVNIHPAHSWQQLSENTQTLYEEAHQARLGTEKFLLDGRPVGTGGGNHIVVGGATPADSPFLRRPDVLGSMIRFWQNHPSLSYLFAGLFIGPTSQAPRADEGRDNTLYELELALQQLPDKDHIVPPWLVDRILRHLLIDLTGNTHRSEICIDKLFSPDSATGRLGLVELRSFEMPPHAQMSLVQQLMVRALISRFWQTPYEQDLVRWGSQLHDRFLLPHFLAADLADVVRDLNRHGIEFDMAWFAPHIEFRFPKLGHVDFQGMRLELRGGLEPWLVLGEEAASGGTSRYVDSSLERIQVMITQFNPERYQLACNGRAVPLQTTGISGEYVAGVRFRAWQPWSCLHPTIPAHGPLIFDIVDKWSGRAVAGCTYYIAHPGGLSHERAPVNSYEAESRRQSLFSPLGHTPGPMQVVAEPFNPDYPTTLDLRRQVKPQ